MGTPDPNLVDLPCPHCKNILAEVEVTGVPFAECARCGGIWVDGEALRLLTLSPQRAFAKLSRRADELTRGHEERQPGGTPRCPKCSAALERKKTHHVEVDVCKEHGTWFDAGELGTLVKRLRRHAERLASAEAATTFRCFTCEKETPIAEANVTANGRVCDGCWRDIQRMNLEAQERRDADVAALFRGRSGHGVLDVLLRWLS